MAMFDRAVCAILLAIAPGTAAARQAAAPPAPAAKTNAHREAALRVIRLGYGAEVLQAGTVRLFAETLPSAFAADPDMREIEASYPGTTAKLIQSFEADIVPLIVRRLPQLWDRLVPVFTQNMTIADLDRMHGYYDSAAGRAFLLETARNIDLRGAIDKYLANDGKAPANDDPTAQARVQAQTYILESMSEPELDAFLEMVRAVGQEKFDRNHTEATQVNMAWFNELNPEAMALLETRMAEFLNAHASSLKAVP